MIKPSRTAIGGFGIGAALLVAVFQHEGYKDEAYIPVPGDVPTIGAGRTEGVKMGDTTNPVREMVYLLNNLEGKYGAGVKKCVTAPLYQHEYEAYVSLAYNIGVTGFCRKALPGTPPNLIDLINAGEYEQACKRIDAFKYGPGRKVLPGLVKRRAKERAICEGRGSNES